MPDLRRAALCCALLLAAVAPNAAAAKDQILVFAAASLKNALDVIAADFTEETGTQVVVSYAGSGQLAKQLIAGAPADLFISANVAWMDQVSESGIGAARQDLLGNRLVLIAHDPQAKPIELSPETDLDAALGDGKLAMALVDSVPAGQYGKAALQNLGLWESLAPSVAQADNVRAALALVSTGEAPMGIVYATDAVADTGVSVIGHFDADTHPPITYPAMLISQDEAARRFYDALSGNAARENFTRFGFDVLK